jgi:hypothetical protein
MIGVKKPPDKGPSTEGPGRVGGSAPHHDEESSLTSTTYMLWNDDSHCFKCAEMAGIRDKHRDRAASPVRRGRGGEGRPEWGEQMNTSVKGRQETEQRTGSFIVETGMARSPNKQGDDERRHLKSQRAVRFMDKGRTHMYVNET